MVQLKSLERRLQKDETLKKRYQKNYLNLLWSGLCPHS